MASSATLTTTHLPQLRAILDKWTTEQPEPKGFTSNSSVAHKDIVVAFRTRPPLPGEAAEKFKSEESETTTDHVNEFCQGITVASAEPGVFVAHVPGMKWSGPSLTHKSFNSDLAFSPAIANEEVYQRTVIASDLLPMVLSGGIGCVLAYGQTGTGKTFTMEGLESRIARDLFGMARQFGDKMIALGGVELEEDIKDGGDLFEFSVTFLELLGKVASDLIETNQSADEVGNVTRKEITITEDRVGNIVPKLVSTRVHSSEELEKLIVESLSHRRTSATLRNATSSRSHALLTIWVKNKCLPFAEPGQLILVDLAGSERYEDSKDHDKTRMEESSLNNKSLMNLKECVRAKSKMATEDGFVHIPWRSNKLTMLLKPIFDVESRRKSKTIIIAHVSPHIQDTVHSTNTLSYAAPFKTVPPKPRGPAAYDPKDPRTWDHAATRAWFIKQFTNHSKDDRDLAQKVEVKRAQLVGKKVRTVKPNSHPGGAPNLPVDIDKFCPPGMTATNFGSMYTTEAIERGLQSRPSLPEGEKYSKVSTDQLKDVVWDVITALNYLIISAKGRTRKDIMKSRKTLAVEDTYGARPDNTVERFASNFNDLDFDDEKVSNSLQSYEEEAERRIGLAVAIALANGEDLQVAKDREMRLMVKEFHEKQDKTKLRGLPAE